MKNEGIPDIQSLLPTDADIEARTLALARHLLARARELRTRSEWREQQQIDQLVRHPRAKHMVAQMTDQTFRSRRAGRAADQLIHILDSLGVPEFLAPVERALLRAFQKFGGWWPKLSMPLVRWKLRRDTARVILPASDSRLGQHIRKRRGEGIRMNINRLGEALLGEEEAARRLDTYLAMLAWPDLRCLSVKISTLYSQISPLDREHSIEVLCDRLDRLHRGAMAKPCADRDGNPAAKFIYLDMEEYHDLHLTAEAFIRCLDRPHLAQARAGMVLQAYLPDSSAVQERLCEWARRRVAEGGTPVTLRIVKGANLEMERVQAAQHGLVVPCFPNKAETDAHFKHMLRHGLGEERFRAVRLGIASHNLFDLAYAMLLVDEAKAWDFVQFEMLEGMAGNQHRAVRELVPDMLLYAPACGPNEFIHAIGYLMRRLDENTGEDHFLRHSFQLQPRSPDYRRLEAQWIASLERIDDCRRQPFRQQDRRTAPKQPAACSHAWTYRNEPETDFALPHNSEWAEATVTAFRARLPLEDIVPVVVAGETHRERDQIEQHQPNRPDEVLGRSCLATIEDVQRAIDCAAADPDGWGGLGSTARRDILRRAAQWLREHRGDAVCMAMGEAGKCFIEADIEINEAIDFIEYYAACMCDLDELTGLRSRPVGPVAVFPPWNFPVAIPCGGVAAALAAGNCTIIKPAPESVHCAHLLCQAFWRAGVSRNTLQFVPAAENAAAQPLLVDPRIRLHVLTGATQTALHFYQVNPEINLSAETGGKNSIIVTGLADRELAIKHIVHSAFGHAGQKCSACSLLILEADVYDDPQFRRLLRDAAASLRVADSWDLAAKVNPLIREPQSELAWALRELDPGEEWLLEPTPDPRNPRLFSPGVKYGVRPGSRSHQTEFFGPVLSVLRADSLDHAIEIANGSPYGLTAGLHSLDDREQSHWRSRIRAGNLYLNRTITGAMVLRQPFGGVGASAYGPGLKAGGPNYLLQFRIFADDAQAGPQQSTARRDQQAFVRSLTESDVPIDAERLIRAAASFHHWAEREFRREHDHQQLVGQDNIRRYVPVRVRLRLERAEDAQRLCQAMLACLSVDAPATVSLAPGLDPDLAARPRQRGTIRVQRDPHRRRGHGVAQAGHRRQSMRADSSVPSRCGSGPPALRGAPQLHGRPPPGAGARTSRTPVLPPRAKREHGLPPLRQSRPARSRLLTSCPEATRSRSGRKRLSRVACRFCGVSRHGASAPWPRPGRAMPGAPPRHGPKGPCHETSAPTCPNSRGTG